MSEVEPLLRASCTHEVDASRPLDDVVAELVRIGRCDPGSTRSGKVEDSRLRTRGEKA